MMNMAGKNTIVRIEFGSHLYGTETPASDHDFKSVHIPDGRSILLQRVKDVEATNTKSDTRLKNGAEDIDDESYSLHKFLQLVSVGDMMATELLFAPVAKRLTNTHEWEALLGERPLILNRQCKGFVGYCRKQAAKYGIKGSRVASARDALAVLKEWDGRAKLASYAEDIEAFVSDHEHAEIVDIPSKGQSGILRHWEVCGRKLPFTVPVIQARSIIQKLFDNYGSRALAAEQNQGVDWKAVSHAVRVAGQSIELLRTGNITFPRPNAAALLVIKRGERPYTSVSEQLEHLLDEVEIAAAGSDLLDESDQGAIDRIILDHYGRACGLDRR